MVLIYYHMNELDKILREFDTRNTVNDFFTSIGINGHVRSGKEIDLKPYMALEKMRGYKLLYRNNKSVLIEFNTYIKYIRREDAFKDNDLKMHIRGGMFLGGGVMIDGHFEKNDEPKKWTHLMLLFNPAPSDITVTDATANKIKPIVNSKGIIEVDVNADDVQYEAHMFYIKLSNYYIFYKYMRGIN